MTWWKQAAERWIALVAVLVVVGGCGGETPTATVLPPVPVKPPLPETSAPAAPPIGLTPLPSAEEVQQAAPVAGRIPLLLWLVWRLRMLRTPRLALP